MKITVNKRRIVLILLSLLTLFLLCFGYFLSKGFPLSWNLYQIEKYADMNSYCEKSRNEAGMSFKCEGFLKWVEFDDKDNVCIRVSVFTKESTLEDMQFCESRDLIDTSNQAFSSEKLVPINFEILFEYKIPFTYRLQAIELNIMEYSDTIKIISDLYDNDIQLFNIWTEEDAGIENQDYYYYERKGIVEGNDLGLFTFRNTQIKGISIKGDIITLELLLKLDGENREAEIQTKEFKYVTSLSEEKTVLIDSKRIAEIPVGKNISILLLYFPEVGELSEESIAKYCLGSDLEFQSICNFPKSIEYSEFKINPEKYLEEILTQEEKIYLNKLILNTVIIND